MNTSITESEMGQRFQRLVTRAGVPGLHVQRQAAGWFDVLAGLYGGPDRAYHTLRHVHDMLDRFDRIKANTGEIGSTAISFAFEIETAIWFHDAIYVPGASDNEFQSAALAGSFLESLGVRRTVQETIRVMIELTTHRIASVQRGAAAIMLDLDLSSLAAPWEDFVRNNANIRRESAHRSDEQYRWGQVAFLGGLMARPAIFYALTDLEQPARRNVEKHLLDLVADRL